MSAISSRADGGAPVPSPGRAVAALTGLRILALKRAATRSADAPWVWIGTTCGLAAAASTIAVAVARPDQLSLLLACWAAGSILAPQVKGGPGSPVTGEFLALSAMTSRQSSLVVTVTALVGLGPAVVLVAGLSQLVLARTLEPLTMLTALMAALLWNALIVALGRVAGELSRRLMRARTGALASGVLTAFLFALAAQGWVFAVAFFHIPTLSTLAGTALHLPSGWGMLAIRAANEGHWWDAAGLLVLLLLAACLLLWSAAMIAAPAARPRPMLVPARRELRARSVRSTALGKALRCILRDPVRLNRIAFALAYGFFFTTMPLVIGWQTLLPYAGPITS